LNVSTPTAAKIQKVRCDVFCTVPKNLKEQEEKFKESGYTINPVFEYVDEAVTTKHLNQFKADDDPALFDVAIKILDAFIAEYKSEEKFRVLEGELIDQA
jgi:hypothetical protein